MTPHLRNACFALALYGLAMATGTIAIIMLFAGNVGGAGAVILAAHSLLMCGETFGDRIPREEPKP